MGSCLILERILVRISTTEFARAICLLMLVHPLTAWVISWPTARKHLLATLFIMLATREALLYKQGEVQRGFRIFLFYFLSLFTWPIGILWTGPFLLFMNNELKQRKHWSLV